MINIKNQKICIVVSTYNKEITFMALKEAKKLLLKEGVKDIDVINAPGAFEIPVIISRHIKKYNGFIAIGCVIKGETNNFDLICQSITNGIMKLSTDYGKPIGYSLITAFNRNQAEERISKGKTAASAVIDVLKNESKKI